MKTLRFLTFACVLTIMGCSSENTRTESRHEPHYSVCIEFIDSYTDICYNMKEMSDLFQWIDNSQYITSEFKREWNKILNEGLKLDSNPFRGLRFDPIFGNQDFTLDRKGFEIEKANPEFVVLKSIAQPEFRFILKIKETNNHWLVDGAGLINIPEEKQLKNHSQRKL